MKLRIVVCAILAVAMVMASAKIRKTDNKKTAKKTETVEQKADTISKEEFSFYMGVAQIGGLKNYLAQRMNVDTLTTGKHEGTRKQKTGSIQRRTANRTTNHETFPGPNQPANHG